MAKRKKPSNVNDILSIGQDMWDQVDIQLGYGYAMGGTGIVDGYRAFEPENYPIKSKMECPYSYSPRILFGDKKKNSQAVYSDRLYQWDYKKYNELCEKHWGNKGQYFDRRSPDTIEKFLSDYMGKKVSLTMVVEWCNVATGYPLWSLHYIES